MSNQVTIEKERLQPFFDKVFNQAEERVRQFMISYFAFGIVLSLIHQTTILALVSGALLAGTYFASKSFFKKNSIHRHLVSVLYGLFQIQFLLQMQGMYQMHFTIFISLTVLLLYEEWTVIIPGTIVSLIGLTFIYTLQDSADYQNHFIKAYPFDLDAFALHGFLIIVYASLCIVWARTQRGQTIEAATTSLLQDAQLKMMDTNINFAQQISQGKLDANYPDDNPDKLGLSLLDMRKSLVEADTREAHERFVNVGLARIGDILRQHTNNLEQLCDKVIEELVKYMIANQGGIFMLNGEGHDKHLRLMACRAWGRKKYLEKTVAIGDGLIGQVVLEKETIFLKNIPDNYVSISSALGEANPNSILIIPLKQEDNIVGAIELASFKEFSKTDIEFLEKVGESIASTMITAQNNQRTKQLLDQSHEMSEQMRAQEEELRQNMEEMQATQEEMARTQRELSEKARELETKQANLNALINNTDDSIITIDKNYKVVVINDVVKRRYKGTQYEGLDTGADALAILGDVRDEWKGYYDKALKGERLNFILKSSVKGEDAFREYFINPIKDLSGTIIGVSVFSRDVTEKHKALEEMRRKSSILDSIINYTDDTYFAIDKDYKIMVVNDVLKNRFRASNIELKEGDNILNLLPKESYEMWKSRYDKALSGEKLRLQEERKLPDKTLFLEVFVDPIYGEKNEVIGCSVISRDISDKKKMMDDLEAKTSELHQLKN